MAQNFDPASLVKDVEAALAKVQPIFAQVEAIANTIAPLLAIFAPFLPAPIGTAIQDLPTIVKKVEVLNQFIDTQLPQLQELLANNVAGTGATEAASLAATDVGKFGGTATVDISNFPHVEPLPSTSQLPPPVAPAGMEYVMLNGQTVLRPKVPVGT